MKKSIITILCALFLLPLTTWADGSAGSITWAELNKGGGSTFWATFSYAGANTSIFGENVTVYKVGWVYEGNQQVLLTLTALTPETSGEYIIPAGKGVLIKSTTGASLPFFTTTSPSVNGNDFFNDNLLHAGTGSRVSESGYRYYKLAYATEDTEGYDKSSLSFCYQEQDGTGITSSVGKAYLKISDSILNPVSHPAPVRFSLDEAVEVSDNATSVEALDETTTTTKFIQNGQLYLVRGNCVYDVTGRIIKTDKQ